MRCDLCGLSVERQVEHELFLARSVLSQDVVRLVDRIHQHHQLHNTSTTNHSSIPQRLDMIIAESDAATQLTTPDA